MESEEEGEGNGEGIRGGREVKEPPPRGRAQRWKKGNKNNDREWWKDRIGKKGKERTEIKCLDGKEMSVEVKWTENNLI